MKWNRSARAFSSGESAGSNRPTASIARSSDACQTWISFPICSHSIDETRCTTLLFLRAAGPRTRILDDCGRDWYGRLSDPTRNDTFTIDSTRGTGELMFTGLTSSLPMSSYESPWMSDELRVFRHTLREFIQEEFLPR